VTSLIRGFKFAIKEKFINYTLIFILILISISLYIRNDKLNELAEVQKKHISVLEETIEIKTQLYNFNKIGNTGK
jgi:hypothetical protein